MHTKNSIDENVKNILDTFITNIKVFEVRKYIKFNIIMIHIIPQKILTIKNHKIESFDIKINV